MHQLMVRRPHGDPQLTARHGQAASEKRPPFIIMLVRDCLLLVVPFSGQGDVVWVGMFFAVPLPEQCMTRLEQRGSLALL